MITNIVFNFTSSIKISVTILKNKIKSVFNTVIYRM